MLTHRKEFTIMLMAVAEIYGKELSEMAINIYYNGLKHFKFKDVENALSHLSTTSRFMPKLSDIYEVLKGNDNLNTQAEVAYNKLIQARKEYGAYTSVVFDDPVIHRIVEQNGGWPEICYMSHEDEQFKAFKKNFINEYMAFSQDKSYIPPPKLVGITEGANRENGFEDEIPEPVYIGDIKKALEWTQKVKQIKAEKQKAVQGKVVDMNEVKAIAKSMAV